MILRGPFLPVLLALLSHSHAFNGFQLLKESTKTFLVPPSKSSSLAPNRKPHEDATARAKAALHEAEQVLASLEDNASASKDQALDLFDADENVEDGFASELVLKLAMGEISADEFESTMRAHEKKLEVLESECVRELEKEATLFEQEMKKHELRQQSAELKRVIEQQSERPPSASFDPTMNQASKQQAASFDPTANQESKESFPAPFDPTANQESKKSFPAPFDPTANQRSNQSFPAPFDPTANQQSNQSFPAPFDPTANQQAKPSFPAPFDPTANQQLGQQQAASFETDMRFLEIEEETDASSKIPDMTKADVHDSLVESIPDKTINEGVENIQREEATDEEQLREIKNWKNQYLEGGSLLAFIGDATHKVSDSTGNFFKTGIDAIAHPFQKKIDNTADEVDEIPNKPVEEIVSTPRHVSDDAKKAMAEKVDTTTANLTKIPKTVETVATDSVFAPVLSAVEEMKATPGRIADEAKKAIDQKVEETVKSVEHAVDEVVSYPGKKVNEAVVTIEIELEKRRREVASMKKTETDLLVSETAVLEIENERRKTVREIEEERLLVEAAALETERELRETAEATILKRERDRREDAESAIRKIQKERLAAEAALKKLEMERKRQEHALHENRLKKLEFQQAPRGVPTITDWMQNRDGTLSGFVKGASVFHNDKIVKTSRLRTKAVEGSVVVTASGSKYYLEPVLDDVKSKKRREKEIAKKKKESEAKKRKELGMRQQERARRDKRKNDIAEEQRALAELQLQEEEWKQKAIAEEKKAMSSVKREQPVHEPKKKTPGKTIPLFDLFGTGITSHSPSLQIARGSKKTQTGLKKAPKGVPTINDWKVYPDKSITGYVHGSPSFQDGEVIVTSPISGEATGGSVVQTSTGSRYFLEQLVDKQNQNESTWKNQVAEVRKQRAESDAEERNAREEAKRKAKAEADVEERNTRDEAKRKAKAEADTEERNAREEATRKAEAEARLSEESKAKKMQTPNLDGFGRSSNHSTKSPTGVATLTRWKLNHDGCMFGYVQGSSSFEDGQALLTSPIRGEVAGGTVIETITGSKYFLEPIEKVEAKLQKEKRDEGAAKRHKGKAEERHQKAAAAKPHVQESNHKLLTATLQRQPQAPKDIPVFTKWRQNKDGSVSGILHGSPGIANGSMVTTAPIPLKAVGGAVVEMSSGESFYLVDANVLATRTPTIKLYSKKIPPKKAFAEISVKDAPKGIPFLVKWKKSTDGTITGYISGSRHFDDGELITTSPIVFGTLDAGEVVETGNGSKYFLF